jgi:hypothetical protein
MRREPRGGGRRGRHGEHVTALFVIETRREGGRWTERITLGTIAAAQDYAWDLLTREGGEVRIRQGRRTIARGVACEPRQ